MNKNPLPPTPGQMLRKLALYGLVAVFSLYLLGVTAGYSWLRYVRKNDTIRVIDVALLRLGAIRGSIAAQHFANAQKEWDARNYQAAYLFFSAAVRQDPLNIPGRLSAVRFLRSVGAGSLALAMLEEGLALTPEDPRLIQPTFEFLLATGRDRRALDLLKKRYGTGLAGKNSALLQRYEIEATLSVDGAPAAKKLLDQHPGLLQDRSATPMLAKVLWESSERSRAIGLLQDFVRTQPAVFGDFAQLARWQTVAGRMPDAVQTAHRACEKFPRESSPRALLIEILMAETPAGAAGMQAIAGFLKDFGSRPQSLLELAALAGQKGWTELARTLYQVGANRQNDVGALALSYSDALARNSRFKEVREILTDLEPQAAEGNVAFFVQLRQRQVIAAAALNDSEGVREYSRRLGALVARDPDGLEACRKVFRRLGIAEAVAELSSRSLVAPTATAAASARK